MRGALDGVREALSELSRLAADALETAGHNADARRDARRDGDARSAVGLRHDARRASRGRLVDEVDPPGFETLAALVPNAGGSGGSERRRAAVLQFPAPGAGAITAQEQ